MSDAMTKKQLLELSKWKKKLRGESVFFKKRGKRKAARKLGELGTERAVLPLVDALADEDGVTRKRVYQALAGLRDQAAVDVLCRLYLDSRSADIADIIFTETFPAPTDLNLKSLYLFLNGNYAELDGVDPDLDLMAEIYQESDPGMQQRIQAQVRKSGETRYTAIIRTVVDAEEGRTFRKEEYAGEEMNTLIDVYVSRGEYENAFRLTRYCTFPYLLRILKALKGANWLPDERETLLKWLYARIEPLEEWGLNLSPSQFWGHFADARYAVTTDKDIETMLQSPDPAMQCKGLYLLSKRDRQRFETILSEKGDDFWLFDTFRDGHMQGLDDLGAHKKIDFDALPDISNADTLYWLRGREVFPYIRAVPCHQFFLKVPDKLRKWIDSQPGISGDGKKNAFAILEIIEEVIRHNSDIPAISEEIEQRFRPDDVGIVRN